MDRKTIMEIRRNNGEFTSKKATRIWLDEYIKNIEKSPILREALAFKALWSKCPLPLFPEELISGIQFYMEIICFRYSDGTYIDRNAVNLYIEQNSLDEASVASLNAELAIVESHRHNAGIPSDYSDEENASMRAFAATSTWFAGHMIPDYNRIMSVGLSGYVAAIAQAREKNPDKEDFYDAMQTILEAVMIYINRYADRAEQASSEEGFDFEHCMEIASDLRFVALKPPENFRQALRLSFIIHLLFGADSFGRFDDYLLPTFQHDMETALMTEQDAYTLLYDYIVKIESINSIENMTIGGCDCEGRPQYTLLTRLIMQVTYDAGYKGPNLCLRITPDMPQDFWELALECLGSGQGLPALYNDTVYIKSLAQAGYPVEVARGYALAGCSQIMIPGRCNFINDIGLINAGKICELTFYNGFDAKTNCQVGLKTGEAESFKSFEELLFAFEQQSRYFCHIEAEIHNKDTRLRGQHEGYALRTLFTRGCIEKGLSVFTGGAEYNNTELEIIGLTNVADSLYAAKVSVFDEKRITMENLIKAMKNNFEGDESLRLYLLESIPKFGNDHKEVDALRARISRLYFRCMNNEKSMLGGVFVPGEVIFVAHEPAGATTGATPDGRFDGQVFADSAGAMQGMDKKGPTALLNSVLCIPQGEFLLTTVVLNMRFLTSTWKSPQSHNAIEGLFKTYFKQGGMQLQINVCNAEILKRALENPEPYRSLIVRVGGYSDYFVNLSPALKREIIRRTEYSVL
jgi:pyruvate-formate lyase